MVAAKKTAAKPAIVLADPLERWMPAEPGELRVYRKTDAALADGVALMRAYLQGVIDSHPSGEAEGIGTIEDFADMTAKRLPLTGDPCADSKLRPRARELVMAFASAWVAAAEEAYYRGRKDEREGC